MAGLSFLGQGVLRPFRRDQKNDFTNGDGIALLQSRVGQVLGTKAISSSASGELPWRSKFGSRLHTLRHRNINSAMIALASAMVVEAIDQWEPNISITSIVPVQNANEPRRLSLVVKFRLVDQNGTTLAEGESTVAEGFI